MINSDLAILDTIISDLDSYYRLRVQATPATVKSYFNTLIDYSIDEVANAIDAHKADVTKGHRHPYASDLLYQLGVRAELNAEALLSEARMKSTPLGMRVLSKIQTLDFNTKNEFELRELASRLLPQVDEWRRKHESAEYTDGEIKMMVLRGIMPYAAFTAGEKAPPHDERLHRKVEQFSNDADTLKIESDHPSGTSKEWYDQSNGKAKGATPMPDSVRQALNGLNKKVTV